MAGLLDALTGGSGPSLNIVPLDQGTQNLIGKSVQNAAQSDSQISDRLNSGVQAGGGQAMGMPSQAQQRTAQTGEQGSDANLQAIRRQYNKVAGDAVGNVVRSNQTNAAMTRANWLQQSARSALAQQQVQTQNYELMTQAMNAADAARAQILSNVLGVGGMAAGMYLASGRTHKDPRVEGVATAENETPYGAGKFNDSFF